MRHTKPVHHVDWKDGFLFVGNHLALDFLNTRPVQNSEPAELLPDFAALLRWFQAAGLLKSQEASTFRRRWERSDLAARALRAIQDLRENLRQEVVAWEAGSQIQQRTEEKLNRLMAHYPMRTRLKVTGENSATELWFELGQPEDLLAPLAHSAAVLFATADRTRVRQCGSCVLHFLDTSKKSTRRWCSMRLCGNRLKVAAYAARRRVNSSRNES